jgi:hypothetical protein
MLNNSDAQLREMAAFALGRAVQVDPIKPKLKPPGTKHLILKYVLSNFAFKFNMLRYSWGAWRRTPTTRQGGI